MISIKEIFKMDYNGKQTPLFYGIQMEYYFKVCLKIVKINKDN